MSSWVHSFIMLYFLFRVMFDFALLTRVTIYSYNTSPQITNNYYDLFSCIMHYYYH